MKRHDRRLVDCRPGVDTNCRDCDDLGRGTPAEYRLPGGTRLCKEHLRNRLGGLLRIRKAGAR